MPKILTTWLTLMHGCIVLAHADPTADLSGEPGQLSSPIEWIKDRGDQEIRYMAQRTDDGRLFLTPNESFFPKLGLAAEGKGPVPDVAQLNGGNSFNSITQWDEGDAAEWGMWLGKTGKVEIHVWTSGSGTGQFELRPGRGE